MTAALWTVAGVLLGYLLGRRRGVRVGLEQRLSTTIPPAWSGSRQRRRLFARGLAQSIARRNRAL